MTTAFVDVIEDSNLWSEESEEIVIEFKDGASWRGFWLLAHSIIGNMMFLSQNLPEEPALQIKEIRASKYVYELLIKAREPKGKGDGLTNE